MILPLADNAQQKSAYVAQVAVIDTRQGSMSALIFSTSRALRSFDPRNQRVRDGGLPLLAHGAVRRGRIDRSGKR